MRIHKIDELFSSLCTFNCREESDFVHLTCKCHQQMVANLWPTKDAKDHVCISL